MTDSTGYLWVSGYHRFWRWARFLSRLPATGAKVSQFALFSFGCVIFFITLTGAFLYGMYTLEAFTERQNQNETNLRRSRPEGS